MNIINRVYINVANLITLLCALFMFGCNDRKQVNDTSPQKASKQVNEAISQQQSESKSQDTGKAVTAKKLTPQPVTAEKDRVAGKYINNKKPSITLEIGNDGTYYYTSGSSYIGGNYVLDGNNITLFGSGKPFEGKIEGAYLIGSNGSRFVKRR